MPSKTCEHEIAIIEDGDSEVPDICADTCKKCGHVFTEAEQEDIQLSFGVWTSSYLARAMAQ